MTDDVTDAEALLARLARPGDAAPGTGLRYGYRLGGLALLVDAGLKSEVMEAARLCPVPRTPPALAGLVNVRGNIVPVFDLEQALGLPPPDQAPEHVLVLGEGEAAAGVRIARLPESVRLAGAVEAAPPPALAGHVQGAWHDVHGTLWWALDHRACFRQLQRELSGLAPGGPPPHPAAASAASA